MVYRPQRLDNSKLLPMKHQPDAPALYDGNNQPTGQPQRVQQPACIRICQSDILSLESPRIPEMGRGQHPPFYNQGQERWNISIRHLATNTDAE